MTSQQRYDRIAFVASPGPEAQQALAQTGSDARKVVYTTLAGLVEIGRRTFSGEPATGVGF